MLSVKQVADGAVYLYCKGILQEMPEWPPFRRRHFKYIFLNDNFWTLDRISLKCVSQGLIDNIAALVQIICLAPDRRQAIIWINDGDGKIIDVYMRHPALMSWCDPPLTDRWDNILISTWAIFRLQYWWIVDIHWNLKYKV